MASDLQGLQEDTTIITIFKSQILTRRLITSFRPQQSGEPESSQRPNCTGFPLPDQVRHRPRGNDRRITKSTLFNRRFNNKTQNLFFEVYFSNKTGCPSAKGLTRTTTSVWRLALLQPVALQRPPRLRRSMLFGQPDRLPPGLLRAACTPSRCDGRIQSRFP